MPSSFGARNSAFLGEHDRDAAVHRQRHGPVRRHLEADLHPQRAFDLVRLHADLRVGAVEDDADALLRERQQIERLQREAQVLQGGHVERAEQHELIRPVERGQHRTVEERRRVDDDDVERLTCDLEQPA